MDPDAVLDTIVDSARRLCRAQAAQVYLIDGDRFTLASSVGVTDELRSHLEAHPIRVDRDTMVGRAATDHSVQQIADAQEDPAYRPP